MTDHNCKNIRQGGHSSIAGGSDNLHDHDGNQYGDFSENWESIFSHINLCNIPKGHSILSKSNLFNYVYCGFIYNSQKLDTA